MTTRLGPRKTLLLAFAAILAVLAGCQVIAGIQSRTLDPLSSNCQLPTGSGPQVRFANLVPTADQVDVCIRPSGSSDWGLPILYGNGTACATLLTGSQTTPQTGFTYGEVSILFNAPAATVDVKTVTGGDPCTAAGLSEGDGLTLATNANTTLASIGGNNAPTQVIAIPEADSANTSGERFRFVHAAPGTGPVDVGLAKDAHLPTTIVTPFLTGPIPYGGTVPASVQSALAAATLEDNGYIELQTGTFKIGANLDGDATMRALFDEQLPDGTATYSAYFIGIAGNNQYPLRALICSEDATGGLLGSSANALVTTCQASPLSSISIDFWNPALYGSGSPDFIERRGAIPGAMLARGEVADVICLNEVDEQIDKDAILAALTSTTIDSGGDGGTTQVGTGPYAYVYLPSTNLGTPFTNPADESGKVPPASTQPPCAGVPLSDVTAAVSCAQTNCSTAASTLAGGTDCLVDNCAAPFIALQTAQNPNPPACYNCVAMYIAADETFAETQQNCTADPRPPMAFDGAENSMIISRYPLNNTDILVLPSTYYRRSVLYASVQLEDQSFDFYCGFLSTTLNASSLPYAGLYGNGATDSQTAYNNEQTYQGLQTIQYVNGKSGTGTSATPAIVVGDWRSSIGIGEDAGVTPIQGTFLPNDLNPPTMYQFEGTLTGGPNVSNWTFALGPAPWGPQCTFCPEAENPYNATDSYFPNQPMLVNWPQPNSATFNESLIYNDAATSNVTIDGGAYPLSPYYGINFHVIRPKG